MQMNCCGTVYMQEKVFSRENEKLNKVEFIRFSLIVSDPSNKNYCKKNKPLYNRLIYSSANESEFCYRFFN